jgi:hypothetical protein
MHALIFDLDGTLRDKLIEHKHYVCSTARTCRRSPAGGGASKRSPAAHGSATPRETTFDWDAGGSGGVNSTEPRRRTDL